MSSPDGVEVALEKIGKTLPIKPSETLSAHQRVQIYANMYFARIHDSLCEDFPTVRSVLGAEACTELIREYLRACPPNSFSLRYAGEKFAHFLGGHKLSLKYPFLSELARLEYALVDIFDQADSEILTAQILQNTAPEQWSELFFQFIPAACLKSFRWQVDSLWENGEAVAGLAVQLLPTHLLIWRKDYEVKYRRIDKLEEELLPLVQKGINFASLCEKASELLPADQAIMKLGAYVQKWVNEGIVCHPERSEGSRA